MGVSPRYQRLPSEAMGRPVHLWTFGHAGHPILVFPSAAGMAHEWQHSGAVEALAPLIRAGRIRLICPESNVSVAWTGDGPPAWRLAQHARYERFLIDELLPYVYGLCGGPVPVSTAGCSFGAFYALNTALKHPERFDHALGLSGRYRTATFLDGHHSDASYFNEPLAYVPGLSGTALAAARTVTATLVVGQGAYEGRCIEETVAMAGALRQRGIPVHLDLWGHDVSHEWVWWRRQLVYHLTRRHGR
jgi:esterase/lipase superfamily enzyme